MSQNDIIGGLDYCANNTFENHRVIIIGKHTLVSNIAKKLQRAYSWPAEATAVCCDQRPQHLICQVNWDNIPTKVSSLKTK